MAWSPKHGVYALGVGKQDDLEQHRGGIGGSPRGVVAEAGIEAAEVDLVVKQVIQGMLEGAG